MDELHASVLNAQPAAEKPRFSRRMLWPWAALAALGTAGALAAIAGPKLAASPAMAPTALSAGPRRVRIAEVQAAPTTREQRFSGALRARQRATLSFTLPGRLVRRNAQVGQRVKRGQSLATLDARELSNAVQGSRAALDEVSARLLQTERDQARTKQLWKSGVVTTNDREQIEAQHAVIDAAKRATRVRLRESQRMLGETVLRAPFDGVVVAVHRERGELVGPATPIVEISGDDRLELEVFVPEQSLARLTLGTRVVVDLPIMGRLGLPAVVRRIGTSAGGAGRLFPVVVELAEPGAEPRPGMTAEVVLPVSAARSLSVPVAAVRDPSGTAPKVMRVHGNTVRELPVRVLELLDDRVLVEGALKEHDVIVVAGHAFLLDGDLVVIDTPKP